MLGREAAAVPPPRLGRYRLSRPLAVGHRLDDHAAGVLGEQVSRGRADALLARGRMDRRPVEGGRADAFGLLDERGAGIASPDQARVYLDPRAPRLDARALEHRAAE